MSELPQGQPFAADFRVGDWLVEPSLDRLSRNGTVRHLRPQLTNLLVLLAQNAGRTVSKDEILSKVWDGQFVAESGMTRCIAEIRQALEDDARDPKIVQTITKRGYRLVAPVTFLDPSPAAEPGAAPPAVEAVMPSSAPAVAADAEPGCTAVVRGAAATPEFRPAVPSDEVPARKTPDRFLRPAAWSLASILGLILVAGLVWVVAGWVKRPVLTERDTVLLADIVNTTGDAAFDQTLRLALGVHLGQAPFLRILPESRMRAALPLMSRPPETPVTGAVALEVCRREGAAVLLAGSVARVGSHYVVGLEALACSDGETIARQLREVSNKDDVLEALGAAAGRIRRTLGESRASLAAHDVPIVQATTPSLEALKALSLGDLARDHARQAEALLYYRRATELDPQFAVAWARRGAAAHNMGQMVGDERSGETDETRLSFRKAYELRERVSEAERFYILGHYYRFVGDPLKAIETYDVWRRTYPNAVVPWTNLASLRVNTLGQYEAALPDARTAVRLMPSSSIANVMLVAACLGTNRLAEAKQAVTDAAAHGASDLSLHRLAFEIALTEDDAAGMEEQVRWAASDPSAVMVMTEYRALASAARGRLRDARRLYAEAAALAEQAGTAPVRAGVLLRQAEMEALLGDARAARLSAQAALNLDGQVMTRLAAASVFALVGEWARATALLEEVSRRGEMGTSTGAVWQPVVRALVEDRLGRPAQALQALRPAAMYERGRNFAFVPLGVRAGLELSAGKAQDAVAAYRDLLSLRPVNPASPWVAFGRLGLARALREAGDIEGSRAAYDALIAWMKDADQDAPVLIAARRERGALNRG